MQIKSVKGSNAWKWGGEDFLLVLLFHIYVIMECGKGGWSGM
jgi:hypothetical protein